MRTCYLHIGMHKTGSSSIQQTLFALGDCGPLVYADISGAPNHSGALIAIFAKEVDRYFANVKRGLSGEQIEAQRQRFRAGLAAAIAAVPHKDLLISGEGIPILEEDELIALREYLLESFAAIRVIGYVRAPKGFMESNFQQLVKGNEEQLSLAESYPAYRDRFEKFDRVFGRGQVLLRKYAPESFPDGCVVRDFCRLLGVDIAVNQILRTNEGISRAAVTLRYTYRKCGPGFGVGWGVLRENARLVEALSAIKGPKLTFSPAFMATVLSANGADIAWMEERLGVSLSEPLTSLPTDVTTEDDLLRNDPEAIAALVSLLAPAARPQPPYAETPVAVAQLVHCLRLQLADEWAQQLNARKFLLNLGLGDLTERYGLSEQELAALILEMYRQIGQSLAAVESGSLLVAGLGRFHVRQNDHHVVGGMARSCRIRFFPAVTLSGAASVSVDTSAKSSSTSNGCGGES